MKYVYSKYRAVPKKSQRFVIILLTLSLIAGLPVIPFKIRGE